MGELRSKQVMVSLEESFYTLLTQILDEENWSASSYFRGLLIDDLLRRELITTNTVLDVLRIPRTAKSA